MNGFYFLNHLYKAVLVLLFSKQISLAFCLLICFNKISLLLLKLIIFKFKIKWLIVETESFSECLFAIPRMYT